MSFEAVGSEVVMGVRRHRRYSTEFKLQLVETYLAGDGTAKGLAPIGRFAGSYGAALDAALALGRPVTVCTIYEGNFTAEDEWPAPTVIARLALSVFNDVITRAALERGVPIIDLRAVCTEPADYANPIERSGQGGWKIARAVMRAVGV